MAWCWFNATESKPHNVKCNIFSELTQNASLLFFRKIISKNVAEKSCVISETEPNFAEKFCVENTLRENMLCVTNQVCVTFENRKPNVVDKRYVHFF
jgi:hypothetical protein